MCEECSDRYMKSLNQPLEEEFSDQFNPNSTNQLESAEANTESIISSQAVIEKQASNISATSVKEGLRSLLHHTVITNPFQLTMSVGGEMIDFNVAKDGMSSRRSYYLHDPKNKIVDLYWYHTFDGYFSSFHAFLAQCVIMNSIDWANYQQPKAITTVNEDATKVAAPFLILVKILLTMLNVPRIDTVLQRGEHFWIEKIFTSYITSNNLFCTPSVPMNIHETKK